MFASGQRHFVGQALLFITWLASSGCRGRGDGGATSPTNGGTSASLGGPAESAGEDSCGPQRLGLVAAKVRPLWRVPAGCQVASSAGHDPPVAIRSEAEFKQRFSCSPEASSGIDFTSSELLVSARVLSPAGTGARVVDDGKTTTIISLFRSPCPSDYPPMPVPFLLAYLMPANATRAVAEISCTFPPNCK